MRVTTTRIAIMAALVLGAWGIGMELANATDIKVSCSHRQASLSKQAPWTSEEGLERKTEQMRTAAVNCGLAQTCKDGYKCCRVGISVYCCPKGIPCNLEDHRCIDSN